MDQQLGTEIPGYRIESLIGRGGMGVVYLAEDVHLKRKVALKVLAPELAQDEKFRERFVRESQLAASLDHPNIIPIFEAREAGPSLYIAMRYVPGTDLKALIGQEGALPPERTVSTLAQVASALDAAHAEGLIHRDVKPGNILITPRSDPAGTDRVFLSDFGLTKRASSDSGLTATGQFVGTLDYATPEQFEGKPLDARTDVYSLGCVLYECLTGEVPFPRENQAALVYAHLRSKPPSISEKHPDLGTGIDAIVAKALAKSPADRFATAGELAREAAEVLGISAGPLRPEFTPMRRGPVAATLKGRLHPRSIAIGGMVAVAVIVGIVLALTSRGGQSASTTSPSPASEARAAGKASVVSFDPDTGKPSGSPIAFSNGTGSLVVGFGSVWVANSDDDTVTRIDARTRKVVATIPVGDEPVGIAVGEGEPDIWVVGHDRVWGIDPVTNSLIATIALENPISIAVGLGSIWVTVPPSRIPGAPTPGLYRIDPSTRTVAQRINIYGPSNCGAVGLAAGQGLVWVAQPSCGAGNPGTLLRIDPNGHGSESSSFPSPVALAVDSASVWLLESTGALSRIDPSTRRVEMRIGVESGPTAMDAGQDGVWIINRFRETLTRIDPATNTADEPIDLSGKPSGVAVGEGMVWVRLDGAS